jgi:hypothetical protein
LRSEPRFVSGLWSLPGKKKFGAPVVGGSEHEKGLGSGLFFSIFFYRVFELPSSRSAQKRDKQKFEKISVLGFWSIFLLKLFDTIVFANRFL